MCVYVRRGLSLSKKGDAGSLVSGAEPSVKNPLLPCYRAQRGIEVSCIRVVVNRVVGQGDVIKPPMHVSRRCTPARR